MAKNYFDGILYFNDFLSLAPSHLLIQNSLKNRSIEPLNEDDGLVGSHHYELIEDISRIECNRCHKFLMDCIEENAPTTGFCGHLFCYECATELHKYYLKEVKDVPKKLYDAHFEIYFADGEPRLFECKACIDKMLIEENKIIRLFSENIMLKNIYTALREPGFFCKGCKIENGPNKRDGLWHPIFNSLLCRKHFGENKKDEFYMCVWHASQVICDVRQGESACELAVMRPLKGNEKRQIKPNEATKAEVNHRLSSLDRNNRMLYVALYHCACCSTSLACDLGRSIPKRSIPVHRHLVCGHFIGDRCVERARTIMRSGKIFCIFCNDYCHYEVDEKYELFTPPSTQLAAIVLKESNYFYKCNVPCNECNMKPCQALTVGPQIEVCPWCLVTHLLADNC